jgi:hypothetical protein
MSDGRSLEQYANMNGFRLTLLVAVLIVLGSIMTGDDDLASFGFLLGGLFATVCFILQLN